MAEFKRIGYLYDRLILLSDELFNYPYYLKTHINDIVGRRCARRKETISLTGKRRWKVLRRTPLARFFGQSVSAGSCCYSFAYVSSFARRVGVDDRRRWGEKSSLRWRRGMIRTTAVYRLSPSRCVVWREASQQEKDGRCCCAHVNPDLKN